MTRRASFASLRLKAAHVCISPSVIRPNYAMLQLLIERGADLEAKDNRGRTPLAVAILRGDEEAIRLLKAAGAATPEDVPNADRPYLMAALSGSVKKGDPMFSVADMRATVRCRCPSGSANSA